MVASAAAYRLFTGGVEVVGGRSLCAWCADDLVAAIRPDLIFHLAAIVSGEAEADFEKGYRVNLDGTRALFEAIGREAKRPTSPAWSSLRRSPSSASRFPTDRRRFLSRRRSPATARRRRSANSCWPTTRRRGFFDGIGLRLPTICIRPGKPNKAASGFFSSILREPLVGQEAVLPVRRPFGTGSPARARRGLPLHAANLDTGRSARGGLSMPGLQRHGGRADRGVAESRWREGRPADPPRAG